MLTKRFMCIGVVLAFLLGVTVVFAGGTGSNAVQEESWNKQSGHPGTGELDWTSGIVESTGIGVINPKAVNVGQARAGCLRAATVGAQRNLLEIIQGVNIDSETTVENFMTTSDVIKTKVTGVLRGAQQKGQPVYKADGTCEVTMMVKVSGALADILLPPANQFGTDANQIPEGPKNLYSGLIIDAMGLGAVPAMAPKVLDETGNDVYGEAFISREYAVEQGVVGYAKSVDQAKGNSRVGSNPLVLKAIKATGKAAADVVISNSDAAKLKDTNIDWGFLKECRVIIVL